jgi:uncharacterized protein
MFTVPIDASRFLVYVPDAPGMPVILSDDAYKVLHYFDGSKQVGEVAEHAHSALRLDLMHFIKLVDRLYETWFLRELDDDFSEAIQWRHRRQTPKELSYWVHLNNGCNLMCEYCFVSHTKEAMSRPVIEATARRIADTAKLHDLDKITVKFAGGEPTLVIEHMGYLYERIKKELESCRTELATAILTNGTHITDTLIDFALESHSSFNISVDGYRDSHDTYRIYRNAYERSGKRIGSWRIIDRNVRRLVSRGIYPGINATISEITSDSLPELVRWVFDQGLHHCRLSLVRYPDCSWENGQTREEVYHRICERYQYNFERTFQVLEEEKYVLDLPEALPIAELSFDRPAPGICCGIGYNHIVIRHDGNVASCPMTVNEESVAASGDLFECGYKAFRNSPLERSEEDGECVACRWFNICAGDCPVTNFRLYGNHFARSPICEFWKYVIPRYLAFYGTKLLQAQAKISEVHAH